MNCPLQGKDLRLQVPLRTRKYYSTLGPNRVVLARAKKRYRNSRSKCSWEVSCICYVGAHFPSSYHYWPYTVGSEGKISHLSH